MEGWTETIEDEAFFVCKDVAGVEVAGMEASLNSRSYPLLAAQVYNVCGKMAGTTTSID